VRALQSFTSKNAASAREVQIVAKQVFALLTDRTRLFFKRRRAGIERTYHPKANMDTLRFSDYLVRRLPLTTGFRNMHVLVRPTETGLPSATSQHRDAGASVVTGLLSVYRLPEEMDRESMDHQERPGIPFNMEEEKYQSDMDQPAYEDPPNSSQRPGLYDDDDDDYDTLAYGVEDKMGAKGPSDDATEMLSILEGMSKLGGPASNSSLDDLNRLNCVDEEEGAEEKVSDEVEYDEGTDQQSAQPIEHATSHPDGNYDNDDGEPIDNGWSEEDAAALRALRDLGYGDGEEAETNGNTNTFGEEESAALGALRDLGYGDDLDEEKRHQEIAVVEREESIPKDSQSSLDPPDHIVDDPKELGKQIAVEDKCPPDLTTEDEAQEEQTANNGNAEDESHLGNKKVDASQEEETAISADNGSVSLPDTDTSSAQRRKRKKKKKKNKPTS
jgi:hypothetical protein